jgi:2-keto-3-deoxy-L-rhamnonate aldolase RhmA
MEARMKNLLKEKLKHNQAVIGTFVGIGHPDVSEWLSRQGFDFLLLDAEHGPLGFETLQQMMQSMNGSGCLPIVRPQWNDPVIIKRVLDIGAWGVLIPWVNSKEEAENAVKACKYPPLGIRGHGPRRAAMLDPNYYATANEEILVTIQIETDEALKNLDEILSVPGIDACYIGPYDLSSNMGFGIPPKWEEPRYLAAFDKVLKTAKKHQVPAGFFATRENIQWGVKKGFKFNTVGDADAFLVRGAQEVLGLAREAMQAGKEHGPR